MAKSHNTFDHQFNVLVNDNGVLIFLQSFSIVVLCHVVIDTTFIITIFKAGNICMLITSQSINRNHNSEYYIKQTVNSDAYNSMRGKLIAKKTTSWTK